MVNHEDAMSERSLSAVDSDAGSICSAECLPPSFVPDLAALTGVNLDRCNDTHVGPKINFNFVLNGNEEDTKLALRPISRILDEKVLSAPNLYQNSLFKINEDKLEAVPSAPYESDGSLASGFEDKGPPDGKPENSRRKPKRACVLAACVAVLLVGGGIGGIYVSVQGFGRSTGATNSSSPAPHTPNPSSPTPTPATPSTVTSTEPTPSSTTPSPTTVSVETVNLTPTNPTLTPSPSTTRNPPTGYHSRLPTTTTVIPIVSVEIDTESPKPSTTPTPIPSGQSYENWGQVSPPDEYQRSAEDLFTIVALDNLPGARCAAEENCTVILKKTESGESLNYNFLIDDSGNMYYARGYEWMSNKNTNIARVAFIGSYDGADHLTIAQIQTLSHLILDNPKHISRGVFLEAQCIENIDRQTGPSGNVICDVEAALHQQLPHPTILTVARSGTDQCAWGPKRLVC